MESYFLESHTWIIHSFDLALQLVCNSNELLKSNRVICIMITICEVCLRMQKKSFNKFSTPPRGQMNWDYGYLFYLLVMYFE